MCFKGRVRGEWMDGGWWMDAWMDGGWMDGWMNGGVDYLNERTV